MGEAEVKVSIDAPLKAVWGFISDLCNVGSCLAFIEKTEKAESGVCCWIIKHPMRSITRTGFLNTIIESKKEASISILAEGSNLKVRLLLNLNPLSENQTKLTVKGSINAKGLLSAILSPNNLNSNKCSNGGLHPSGEGNSGV